MSEKRKKSYGNLFFFSIIDFLFAESKRISGGNTVRFRHTERFFLDPEAYLHYFPRYVSQTDKSD
jgi:hypothetical protein